jgi:ATP-dependent Clp protease ATP-binding subunit ClpB
MQLEIEREALKKEKDDASRERLAAAGARAGRPARAAATRPDRAGKKSEGDPQVQRSSRSRSTRCASRLSRPSAPTTCKRPRELRYGKLRRWSGSWPAPRTRGAMQKRMARCSRRRSTPRRSPPSSASGPASRSPAAGGRARQAAAHGGALHRRVVGQDEAVRAVARHPPQPRRAAGSQPADRQLHLPGADRRGQDRAGARLAEFLFDDEHALVRIDMSEYQERHTVAG